MGSRHVRVVASPTGRDGRRTGASPAVASHARTGGSRHVREVDHASPRERGSQHGWRLAIGTKEPFSHQQVWRSRGCPGANEKALVDVEKGLVLGRTYDYTKSMSTTPSSLTPPAPARLSSALGTVLDEVLCGLETVRVADRTMASDGERLGWIEQVTEAERRVSALKAVLIGEADEAGSAMRARHTPLRDWLAGVRDAAASGRISLEQAAAINEALDIGSTYRQAKDPEI